MEQGSVVVKPSVVRLYFLRLAQGGLGILEPPGRDKGSGVIVEVVGEVIFFLIASHRNGFFQVDDGRLVVTQLCGASTAAVEGFGGLLFEFDDDMVEILPSFCELV